MQKFAQRRQRFARGPVTSGNNFKPSKTNKIVNIATSNKGLKIFYTTLANPLHTAHLNSV